MKRLLIILFLFLAKVSFGQQPQAPIIFADTTQMISYNGSYALGVIYDTTTGGVFYKQLSSANIDNIRVFRAANTSYRWFKLSTYYKFINGLNGQVPYFTEDNTSNIIADDLLNVAKFVYTDAQLDSMKMSRIAQIEIFGKWGRFAHGGVTGAPGSSQNTDTIPITPDATNSFSYDPVTNLVNSTFNTGAYIGLISNEKLTNYTLTGTVSSTAGDNDYIGLVIAYVEDKDSLVRNNAYGLDPNDFTWPINVTDSLIPMQHTLTLYRGRSNLGNQYRVSYDDGLLSHKTIFNGTSLLSYKTTNNWNGSATESDLKIVRTGDTIKVFTTEYADAPGGKGALGHEIDVILTSDPVLEKFRSGSYFGVTCESQQNAYWQDLVFTNNTLNIYDLRNGDVWVLDSTGTYVLSPTLNTFIDVGIRRFWYNPYLETFGYINPDSSYYVIDSSFGGGSGNTNSNVGSGYRLAIPNTNNVKTLYMGTGITLDSVANANGITISAVGTGLTDSITYYNVTAFGVVGDGTTDNYAAANTANSYVASQGGGVLWWPAGTYRTSKPIYRLAGVHWYGVQDQSIITNTNDTVAEFNSQGCQFMGNYTPSDYDTSVARYYVGHMGTYSNKMAIVDSISRFAVGDVVFIAGATGYPTADGHYKYYVSRFNEIDSIYSDTVVFKYQLDTLLTTARITISGHFITMPHNDTYGHARYFLKNCATQNMTFVSKGQWMLGEAALNCNMTNIGVRAAELLSTNGLAFCTINNIYGNWWKQVIEFAIGCHNTTVNGVNAQYINGNYLVSGQQPFIKFGEQCYDMTIRNAYVNAGNWAGRSIWFGAATHGLIDNIEVRGQNIQKQFLDFSNTDAADTSISTYVTNNRVMNSRFYNNGSLNYYVYMDKPNIAGAKLENNSIQNCTFNGIVSGSHALLLDGANPLVTNSNFNDGIVAFGDSLTNGVVQNTEVGNPTVYNANCKFIGAYNSTTTNIGSKGISLTEGTGMRIGQTTLVAGTKAITISGLTTSSRAIITLVTPSGASSTIQYQAVCTSNTLTIQANVAAGTINTSDGSTVNYLVIN